MSGTRSTVSLLVALTLTNLMVSRALSHAPPEVLDVLSRAPNDVVIATTRGLVFGELPAHRFSLLCTAAFGLPAGSSYHVTRTPGNRLLVGDPSGLRYSDDRGCTWHVQPELGALAVTAMRTHPAFPERVYVSVHAKGRGGIHVSEDGGRSFRRAYAAPDDGRIDSLIVGKGDPPHLYATFSADGDWTTYQTMHSADGGATWASGTLRVDEAEIAVTLLAVNPADPRELLARTKNRELLDGDRLLASTDFGLTFREAGRFNGLTSAAFSADGALAFASTVDGLLRADTPARAFVPVGDSAGLGQLTLDERELLVGGYYADGERFVGGVAMARLSDPSATFTRFMTYDEVKTPSACAAPSTVMRDCALDWEDWDAEFISGLTSTPSSSATLMRDSLVYEPRR